MKRGVLDEEMVWSSFGWWVSGYHRAVTRGYGAVPNNLILQLREDSHREDFFREFEDLNRRIGQWRAQKEPKAWTFKNDADFLAEEASLVVAVKALPNVMLHPLAGASGHDLAEGSG